MSTTAQLELPTIDPEASEPPAGVLLDNTGKPRRCRQCQCWLMPPDAVTTPASAPAKRNTTTRLGVQLICKPCDAANRRTRYAATASGQCHPAVAFWHRIGLLDILGTVCYICTADIGAAWWHAEHIIPKSRGGCDAVTNLAPACPSCNSSKRTRSVANILAERHPRWQTRPANDPAWGALQRATASHETMAAANANGDVLALIANPTPDTVRTVLIRLDVAEVMGRPRCSCRR